MPDIKQPTENNPSHENRPLFQRSLFFQMGRFLWRRKLYWLAPIFILLALVAGLLFVGQSTVLSPFIYVLF